MLAWFLFRENIDRRIVFGMAAIVAGAAFKLKGLIVTRRHLTVARSAGKSWQDEQIEPW